MAILKLQIKAAFSAVRNVNNLPPPRLHLASDVPEYAQNENYKSFNDILEWLAAIFGFQVTCASDFSLSFSFRIFVLFALDSFFVRQVSPLYCLNCSESSFLATYSCKENLRHGPC